jgi:hypothetical protein
MKFVFFIRRYNDIDHITPIIYRMAKDGYKGLEVLCINPTFDIENDFRLFFLKDEYQVTVDYVYRTHYPTIFHRFLAYAICGSFDPNILEFKAKYFIYPIRLIQFCFRRYLFNRILERLVNYRFFGEEWAISMLKSKEPSVLIFDWHRPKQYNVRQLICAAKKLDIPIISVPHGMNLFHNKLVTWKAIRKGNDDDYGRFWEYFDHNIVQFDEFKTRVVEAGVPENKVSIIGSTRFCSEWESVLKRIRPQSKKLKIKPGKLKLVFMDHNATYRIDKKIVSGTIDKLNRLDFIDLKIKPSTGSIGLYKGKSERFSSKKAINENNFAENIDSLDLIDWADAVICTTSSICLDVLLNKKIFIYPKYFHENTMLFEKMNACWQIDSYEELESGLVKLVESSQYRPYSDNDVEDFLIEVINGGVKGRDVLGEYSKYITMVAMEKN